MTVADEDRGAVATMILKAIMAGGAYPPEGVPDTPHNRQVWESMKADVDSLPPGGIVDIRPDWADT